jgi:hypothetical protein
MSNEMRMTKLRFGRSNPYKNGLWADWIEVFLGDKQIGMLYAEGENHRKYMAYHFTNRLENRDNSPRSEYDLRLSFGGFFGLRAAKMALQVEVDRFLAAKKNAPLERLRERT